MSHPTSNPLRTCLLAGLLLALPAVAACAASDGREAEAGETEARETEDRDADARHSDPTPHESHADEAAAIVRLLDIEAGDAVADVGAGDGDWTDDLARAVGRDGIVWATEVKESLIEDLEQLAADKDLPQIRPVLGDQDDNGLGENCCDAVLLRLVYHHFTDPAPMRADLRRAMKPGARLLVIDILPQDGWRDLEGVPERGGHGIPTERLIEEMESDGFRAVERLDDWGDEEDEFALVFVESE